MEFAKEVGKFLAGLRQHHLRRPTPWELGGVHLRPRRATSPSRMAPFAQNSCLYTVKVARRFCLQHGLSWWPAL